MPLSITAQPIPLTLGEDGVARLADTRVRLEAIVAAFHEGVSAEEISLRYTTVDLADVYLVIGFYLKNRYEVDKYLESRRSRDKRVREELRAEYLAGAAGKRRSARSAQAAVRLDRITIDPARRGGRPCIRGLEVEVADVLNYLAGGMNAEDVLADWPDLEPEDIAQALAYAARALDQGAPSRPKSE
jgi:uncharacterized protein (DUF433 family)